MRKIAAALVLACVSGATYGQDTQVDKIFGPTPTIRRAAQLDFVTHYLTDPSAIQALVEATAQENRKRQGAFSPGVYDAISVLARVPPDSVADPALRARVVQVAQASSGNSADTTHLVSLIVPRFSSAARPLPPPLPPLQSAPSAAPVIAPPAQAPTAATRAPQTGKDYVITVSMAPIRGVSTREHDYFSLTVIGPGGQVGPFNKDSPTLELSSGIVRVANGQDPSVRISWTAVNTEDISNGMKLATALGNSAADVARGSPNPIAAIVGEVAKIGLSFLKGCDAPLFGGAVMLYTDKLADGQTFDEWRATGTNRWRREFEYPNVASPCQTGHYKVEVKVEQQ